MALKKTFRRAVEAVKARKLAKKAGTKTPHAKKAGKVGAALGDPVLGGAVKVIAGRHKGGKNRVKSAAKHMAEGTNPKGRKVKKVLKRANDRKAAGGDAFTGKYGQVGNSIASGAKGAAKGARNPAAKAPAKSAAPSKGRKKRGSGMKR